MADIDDILSALEDVDEESEHQVESEIYSNLVRLYRFASQEEADAEETLEGILSASDSGVDDEYPLQGLEEGWDRHADSFEEMLAYADAIDHLEQARSLKEFSGRMRRGMEFHEGWKEDVLKMIENPDYESPIGRDRAEGLSSESVEEVSNGYEIAVRTAIEPVVEQYDLV